MKNFVICLMAAFFLANLWALPPCALAGSDEYENLEFFLDRALKQTKDSDERLQILNRYTIKMLGLIYRQNQELLRLNRETIGTLQKILQVESEEKKELERQLREMQNQLPRR